MVVRSTVPRSKKKVAPLKAAYFNRELSWLAFDRRVLEQAQSDRHPLLERVRFLAIVSSNLDEFFEIRVAGIIQQMDSGHQEEDDAVHDLVIMPATRPALPVRRPW